MENWRVWPLTMLCSERNMQLEPAGSAKRGLKDGPADMSAVVAY